MTLSPREKALEYLRTHHVLTLATTGMDGPWAAAVFYVNDGFTLYFLSAPSTRHAVNLGARAEVAGAIQEDYRDWKEIKGIQLEGQAHKTSGAEQASAIARFTAKFPVVGVKAPAEITSAIGRVWWYRLVPERMFFIDNSLGLGHREEVPLSG